MTSGWHWLTRPWLGFKDRSKAQKMSILERAQGLEWPQFFVDIRHDASHQAVRCDSFCVEWMPLLHARLCRPCPFCDLQHKKRFGHLVDGIGHAVWSKVQPRTSITQPLVKVQCHDHDSGLMVVVSWYLASIISLDLLCQAINHSCIDIIRRWMSIDMTWIQVKYMGLGHSEYSCNML